MRRNRKRRGDRGGGRRGNTGGGGGGWGGGEDSLAGDLLGLAFESPYWGLGFAGVFLVVGLVLWVPMRSSMMGMGWLFSLVPLGLAAVCGLGAVAGFVRRLFRGVATRVDLARQATQSAPRAPSRTVGVAVPRLPVQPSSSHSSSVQAVSAEPPKREPQSGRRRRRRRFRDIGPKPAWMKGYNDVVRAVNSGAGAPAMPRRTPSPPISSPAASSPATVSSSAASPANPSPLPAASERVKMPYKRCDRLLSKGEHAFWHPLFYAVRGKYRIFPKVRLADVVRGPDRRDRERYWFNRIGRFHIDFVLCDPDTTEPLMAIELDDASHRTPRPPYRARRDAFKDQVLADAGIPVLRIPTAEAYSPEDLAEKITTFLTRRTPQTPPQV